MSLVNTDWLLENLDNVKIIDSSWHLPNQNRNAKKEYSNEHILNSIFFDIDKNSDQETDLPHMLPSTIRWENIVSNLGISNEDTIIIYDNSDLISSCRCWYTFLYFGHDPSLVSVLNGGLKKWKQEEKPTVNSLTEINRSIYKARENKENLAQSALKQFVDRYEGTRLGRQELYAEILDDFEGALWNYTMLEDCRVTKEHLPEMTKIIVSIDPAVTANANSDETGIIVSALGEDERYYILEDKTGKYSLTQKN